MDSAPDSKVAGPGVDRLGLDRSRKGNALRSETGSRFNSNPKPLRRSKNNNTTRTITTAPSSISTGCKDVHHLCIDMNQFLHSSFRRTASSQHFVAKVYNGIDKILSTVKPQSTLVLVFDGSAPFAKMQTQRLRRSSHPENSLLTPGNLPSFLPYRHTSLMHVSGLMLHYNNVSS